MKKVCVAAALLLVQVQSAWADCADLNRRALPNKAAFQTAADEYKNSVVSHLRSALNNTSPPPIDAIAEGVVATSKMITAFDKMIGYLRTVLSAGCFGSEANAWSAAIAKFQSQSDDMHKDRKLYIETLSIMSKVEDKPRN